MNDKQIEYLCDLSEIQLEAQALSMTVFSLFRKSYNYNPDSEETQHILEAFRSLRRVLPLDEDGKHIGADLLPRGEN